MRKFFICSTASCMERMLDCEKIYNYLIANKWHPVREVKEASLIIISTCSFGKAEDKSSLDFISYYTKNKLMSTKVIIAGCMPKINPSVLDQIGKFETVSPTNLDELDKILKTEKKFRDIGEPNKILPSEVSYSPVLKKILFSKSVICDVVNKFNLRSVFSRQRIESSLRSILNCTLFLKSHINPLIVGNRRGFFYLRISKGCLSSCSYCAKRFATGITQSKPIIDVIAEFKKGLETGHKKFYLLTEDSGSYGLDLGIDIIYLLNEIFRIGEKHDYKLIISNFNAQWFVKYYNDLEKVLLENSSNISYIQIPIQSGSNKILGFMERRYSIEDVERCLLKLREKAPDLNITTDIIVGFPGETDDDFNKTKELLRKKAFKHADIFGYEDRPNTPAYRMTNKISQSVIGRRTAELLRMQNSDYGLAPVVKKIIELIRDYS